MNKVVKKRFSFPSRIFLIAGLFLIAGFFITAFIDYFFLSDPKIPSGPTEVSENSLNLEWVLGFSIIFLSLTTIFLVLSIIYLFKWRKHISPKQKSIVPSELLKEMEFQKNNLIALSNSNKEVRSQLNVIFGHFEKTLDELTEAIHAMKGVLDEKDREIKDLKTGYELQVFEKFLRRFIKVHHELEQEFLDFKETGADPPETLIHIHELLTDALEECNVEIYSPKIGEDFKKAFGVDEHFKKAKAQNPKDDFKIIEVLTHGYVANTPNGKKTIKPARVVVAIYEKEEG